MRMPKLMRLAACSVLIVLSSGSVAIGQTETATISGLITDETGSVVPGAGVDLQSVERGTVQTVTTNNTGIYVFASVQPGQYQIRVKKPGFKQVDFLGMIVNVQDHIEQNFRLQLGSVSESVTVEANGLNINTESAAVGTLVDRNFVESIPLNGRSLQPLITLTAGVVLTPASEQEQGQFSVNGQRADANYFMVDGVSANFGASSGQIGQIAPGTLPGLTAGGGTNSLVSIDSVQEFRIETSSYAPEFGRTPGGQISIVTRSGTNQFHGDVFDYFRNEALDANNWFNDAASPQIRKPAERQNDFGGVIGGPILRDRTFFFFSYEGLRLQLPTTGNVTVPTVAFRQQQTPANLQPLLNALPIPNGKDFGNGTAQFIAGYSSPVSLDATSIRIDHKLNGKVGLFGRYNYSPSQSTARSNGLTTVSTTSLRTQTFTLGSSQLLAANLSNDFRFNWSRSSATDSDALDNFGGAVPPPVASLFPAGFSNQNGQINFFFPGSGFDLGKTLNNIQQQLNLVDALALSHGSHQLKFGFDYRQLRPDYNPPNYAQVLLFFGLTGPFGVTSGTVPNVITAGEDTVHLFSQNLSLFGQDTWRINSRFTLTYGLRWELNPAIRARDGQSIYTVQNLANPQNFALAPPGTPFYNTSHDDVAPRLGFAARLSTRAGFETTLRAGFGIFYDLGAGVLAEGSAFFPYARVANLFNVPYPVPADMAAPLPFTTGIPAGGIGTIFAADPNLRLPRTYQWNVALEQSLGAKQSLSLTYLGAAGRDLLRMLDFNNPNPNFQDVLVTTNSASSNYNAFQIQYQRRLSRGVQALGFYSWSHCIDDASNDSNSFGNNPSLDRGNCDYDIRHSFHGVVTYNLPTPEIGAFGKALLGGWAVDMIGVIQSAPPVDLSAGASIDSVTQRRITIRPDIVPGKSLYLYGGQYPGGKALNPEAFTGIVGDGRTPPGTIPVDSNGNPLRQGTLGRNAVRGFGVGQVDLALRRQFNFTDRCNLQFSGELFNIVNHPNFGAPTNDITQSTFGLATQTLANSLSPSSAGRVQGFSALYQVGGPRSVQLALKLSF